MRVATADGHLFLDVRGRADAPPLLYLHGGPGMGCREFMEWQGEGLGNRLRLIGLDQRGVLRSDPLGTDESLNEEDLVDDCEALRISLGLKRWAILGHSFGGRVALRYAVRHPEAVSAVLFENPAWDVTETERLRLPAAAAIYDELGDESSAQRCRELAAGPLRDRWESIELVGALQEYDRYYDLYVHQPLARVALDKLEADNPLSAAEQDRGDAHGQQLMEASDLMESMLPLLPGLRMPALLIKGRYDLVTGPAQLAGFDELVPDGRTVIFEESSHFVQLEEPERYADLVAPFTLRHLRS